MPRRPIFGIRKLNNRIMRVDVLVFRLHGKKALAAQLLQKCWWIRHFPVDQRFIHHLDGDDRPRTTHSSTAVNHASELGNIYKKRLKLKDTNGYFTCFRVYCSRRNGAKGVFGTDLSGHVVHWRWSTKRFSFSSKQNTTHFSTNIFGDSYKIHNLLIYVFLKSKFYVNNTCLIFIYLIYIIIPSHPKMPQNAEVLPIGVYSKLVRVVTPLFNFWPRISKVQCGLI